MTDKKRGAVIDAAGRLAGLADRLSRAAQSMTRMVAMLATSDDGTEIVASIAKYVNAGMPEAEAVSDVAVVLEGAQSPEWRDKRAKMRQRGQKLKLEWQLSTGRFADADIPTWGRDSVLNAARERRDVMAAAIAACEQRRDSDEILAALAQHLAGRDGIHAIERVLQRAGLSIEGSNVVPLIPRGRAS